MLSCILNSMSSTVHGRIREMMPVFTSVAAVLIILFASL